MYSWFSLYGETSLLTLRNNTKLKTSKWKLLNWFNTEYVLTHSPIMMIDQPNRWAFWCRVNVAGERVAVRRAAGKLFQMTGPATTKLLILIPSVGVVLGTGSNAVRADRKCFLPAIAEIARQSSCQVSHIYPETLVMTNWKCISDTPKNEQRVDPPIRRRSLCSRSTSFTRPRVLRQFSNPIYPNIRLYCHHICYLQSTLCC